MSIDFKNKLKDVLGEAPEFGELNSSLSKVIHGYILQEIDETGLVEDNRKNLVELLKQKDDMTRSDFNELLKQHIIDEPSEEEWTNTEIENILDDDIIPAFINLIIAFDKVDIMQEILAQKLKSTTTPVKSLV